MDKELSTSSLMSVIESWRNYMNNDVVPDVKM